MTGIRLRIALVLFALAATSAPSDAETVALKGGTLYASADAAAL